MELIKTKYWVISFFAIWLASCSEPFVPDTSDVQPLVVEGYVEAGNGANITYVFITRSLPFIADVSAGQIADLFVHDAVVNVHDGDKNVLLPEVCLDDLPIEIKLEVLQSLGVPPNIITSNICAYVDIGDQITREAGRSYALNILVEDQQLSATTTIPDYVPLYDFRFDQPAGEPSDVLARLFTTIDDPANVTNFYRYKTAEGNQPFVTPFTSVINDALYDGESFEFPLAKAEDRTEEVPFDEFGLFLRGDSITLKWMCIDQDHYNFWNTRDFAANSQGPFSSYTRINGNVSGALGIWGGISLDNYRLYVPFN